MLKGTSIFVMGFVLLMAMHHTMNAQGQTADTALLPYYCGFEDTTDNVHWHFYSQVINKWVVGSATAVSGTHSMYVSNNGGASNAYSGSNTYSAWAYRDFYLNPQDKAYKLYFDFKGMGDSWMDNMSVFLGPPVDYFGDMPSGSIQLFNALNNISSWTTFSHLIDSTHSGVQRLYFKWSNDYWDINNPPAAIDNIVFEGTTCLANVTNMTACPADTVVFLTWTSPDVESYTIEYKSVTDSVYTVLNVSASSSLIGNLLPSTEYMWRVRANCSATEQGFFSEVNTFTTAAAVAHLPYSCSFENPAENAEWMLSNQNYTNKWHIGEAVSNDGSHSLYVSNNNGVSNSYTVNSSSVVWACRDFVFPGDVASYQISFDIRSYGEIYNNHPYDYVKVFVGPPSAQPLPTGNNDVPPLATQLGAEFQLDSIWHNAVFTLDSTHSGPQRLYFLWKNDDSFGTNPPGAVDNIQITTSDCPIPAQLAAVNILDDVATLTWESDAPTFVLAYKLQEDSVFTEVVLSETSYPMTGLMPDAVYEWKIKSLCSNEEQSFWSYLQSFQTLSFLGRIPYENGFEDPEENNYWKVINYYGNNHWCSGTATHKTGTHSMYVSNNDGVSYTYTNSSVSYSWAYRDFYFDPDYSSYDLSFDYKVKGGAGFAGMRVFVGPPTTPVDYSVPAGSVQLGNSLYGHVSWTHFSYTLDATFQGVQRLYFLWANEWSVGDNPPAAIDNVTLEGLHCGVPVHIAVDSVTAHDISVHFTPASIHDSVWEAAVVTAGTPIAQAQLITITDTVYTFENLQNNTTYDIYLRTSCGNGESSYWSQAVTQRTDCGYISSLPYTDNFDTYGSENYPWCWYRLTTTSGTYPYIDLHQPNHYDATYSTPGMLLFSAPAGTYNIAVMPEMDHSIPMNELLVSFQYRAYNPDDRFEVGVMSDPLDASTFVPMDTVWLDYYQVEHWTEKKVTLSGYSGEGHFIAFKHYSSTQTYAYLDNVRVEATTCPLPVDVTVTNVTSHSATIDWTPSGDESEWIVVVKPHVQSMNYAVVVTSHPYTVDNLKFGEWYDVYVKAKCGNEEVSSWSLPATFFTQCSSITQLPYIEDFENYYQPYIYNEYPRPRCWTFPHIYWAYPEVYMSENAQAQDHYVGNSRSLIFKSSINHEMLMAVMPPLEVDIHNVKLSLRSLAESVNAGRIEVGVVNSDAEESSFEIVHTIYASDQAGSWVPLEINLDSTLLSGTGNHIAFRYYPYNYNWAMWLDDLELSYINAVGIVSHNHDNSIRVFPNPTNGRVTVAHSEEMIRQLEVFDMYGKMLVKIPVEDYETTVDLSSYAKGVYVFRITIGGDIINCRVVVR